MTEKLFEIKVDPKMPHGNPEIIDTITHTVEVIKMNTPGYFNISWEKKIKYNSVKYIEEAISNS